MGIKNVRFDFERAKKVLTDFCRSCDIDSVIIDNYGNEVIRKDKSSEGCGFCRRVCEIVKNRLICRDAHLYGCYQAERFGGKYIFFCPLGLVHWSSPLLANGEMAGAIIGGPVMMVDPDEFLIEEIFKKNNIEEEYIPKLKKLLGEVPLISPERVNSLSEMSMLVAGYISGNYFSDYYFLWKEGFNKQQCENNSNFHNIELQNYDRCKLFYPIEKEKELRQYITTGDKKNSQILLNEILGHIFFSTGGDLEIIKSRIFELVVVLSRAAMEGGADIYQILGMNYNFLMQLNSKNSIEEIAEWLSNIMVRFTDCVFNLKNVKHLDVIYKSLNYIKENYRTKISLDDVSAYVNLSPSYFSTVFKEEMKCNFNEYLNRYRIKISKNLLLDDSITLADVSNYVGYEEQSYFTRIFKRIVGVSPGKYRECRGYIVKLGNSDK